MNPDNHGNPGGCVRMLGQAPQPQAMGALSGSQKLSLGAAGVGAAAGALLWHRRPLVGAAVGAVAGPALLMLAEVLMIGKFMVSQ